MNSLIPRWQRAVVITALASIAASCGGGKPADEGSREQPQAAATRSAAEPVKSSEDWKPSITTASVPANPCDWIPAADVEAIMGKLAEPPKKADGCRYTLVVPEAVAAKRQQAIAMQQKISQAFGQPALELGGSMANTDKDPRSYAVVVSVDVNAKAGAQATVDAATRQMGIDDNPAMGKVKTDAGAAPAGWDDARRIPYGFIGRVGHVQISVQGEAPDVPREPMQALAERVRDRVPDRPFPVTNPYQVMQLGPEKDPCTLLTRAEAEAVLGTLAIDPYRASSYFPPLAHGKGDACAYFAPGHHVFVLSPTWTGGAEVFKLEKGVGGLIGMVAPQEAVIIKGPWDQSQVSAGTGALLFLKGEQLLEVHYLTSRASRADAIKLAATAMGRMDK